LVIKQFAVLSEICALLQQQQPNLRIILSLEISVKQNQEVEKEN